MENVYFIEVESKNKSSFLKVAEKLYYNHYFHSPDIYKGLPEDTWRFYAASRISIKNSEKFKSVIKTIVTEYKDVVITVSGARTCHWKMRINYNGCTTSEDIEPKFKDEETDFLMLN